MENKKSILITGMPCAGKTTLHKYLKKGGYESYDIDDEDESEDDDLFSMLYTKTGKEVKDYRITDLEQLELVTWTCNLDKLKDKMRKQKTNVAYYCTAGFKSNVEETLHLFDTVILLQPTIDIMKERLKDRTLDRFGGSVLIRDYILKNKTEWEEKIKSYNPIVIDADADVEQIARSVIK